MFGGGIDRTSEGGFDVGAAIRGIQQGWGVRELDLPPEVRTAFVKLEKDYFTPAERAAFRGMTETGAGMVGSARFGQSAKDVIDPKRYRVNTRTALLLMAWRQVDPEGAANALRTGPFEGGYQASIRDRE